MDSSNYDTTSSNYSYNNDNLNNATEYQPSQDDAEKIVEVFFIFYYIAAVTILVLYILGLWKIFRKAGEEGWKSIIPFYNTYTLFKISWKVKYFWIFLALAIITPISSFVPFLPIVLAIAALVINIRQNYFLARSFKKGLGFTIGLVLLTPFFYTILAFSSSTRYHGNGFEICEKEKALKNNFNNQVV